MGTNCAPLVADLFLFLIESVSEGFPSYFYTDVYHLYDFDIRSKLV